MCLLFHSIPNRFLFLLPSSTEFEIDCSEDNLFKSPLMMQNVVSLIPKMSVDFLFHAASVATSIESRKEQRFDEPYPSRDTASRNESQFSRAMKLPLFLNFNRSAYSSHKSALVARVYSDAHRILHHFVKYDITKSIKRVKEWNLSTSPKIVNEAYSSNGTINFAVQALCSHLKSIR